MFEKIEKSKKLYEIVIEQIQRMIITEKLKRGDRLPSERDLSEKFNISRPSVREALKALEIMGLIETRQGDGNFVKGEFTSAIYEPLSLVFYLDGNDPHKLLEFRKIVEVGVAELAAANITKEALRVIEKLVNELESATVEEEAVKIDSLFHHELAKASNNALLIQMFSSMSMLYDNYVKEYRQVILSSGENKEKISSQHRAIYEAIKQGHRANARQAMRLHLELIERHLNLMT